MKIYFIAICGTGVGNLAILLKNQGHDVRGSEYSQKVFYPPISDLLKEAEIPVTFGFDPEEITPDIDLVVMGGAAFIHDPNNSQVARAKELGLNVISYASGVGRFLSKENNIEVVGNHAKTTTSALTAWCLKTAGVDVSYFIGGAAKGFENTIYSGNDTWSVCEGDEHPSLNQEPGGKFLYHNPKHVIFTSADWDHKNIYTTEEDYLNVFRELFKILPPDGLITACLDGKNVLEVLTTTKNVINLYSTLDLDDETEGVDPEDQELQESILKREDELRGKFPKLFEHVGRIYFIEEVDYTFHQDKTRFIAKYIDTSTYEVEDLHYFTTPLIGRIGVENCLAVISCLHGLGFDIEKIREGIETFQGVKRKLELVYDKDYKVINDHAHSPIKIESAIKAVRTKYPNNKIFTIFHVHQSALKEPKTFEQLKTVFNNANFVLIPHVNPDLKAEEKFFGKDYKELIKEGALSAKFLKPENVYYTPLMQQAKSIIENNLQRNDVILILGNADVRESLDMALNLNFIQRNLY